ncbi:MAG: DUF547 domain-containing protein [Woeseia sp.]
MNPIKTMSHCALLAIALWATSLTNAAESAVPEPFRGFDASSTYTISYEDLNSLLSATVLAVGRSDRDTAAPTQAKTGTRVKNKVNNKTANEGNRFYFESFKDTPEYADLLNNIQSSLEKVPDEVPLRYFSRNEQLAYWINLYNVTLLKELVALYPQRSLKKVVAGNKSILSEKLLTVAGVPLSLDDIQHTILRENYNNSPLVIYGLYQGIIGGPNIRRRAYTGDTVHESLQRNAAEFINSNRGTFARDETVFRVSSLYERNSDFFANFDADLKAHLLEFLEGSHKRGLQTATAIRPDINDWTITDLYGSFRQKGGSAADNRAALMGAIQNTSITDSGGTITTTLAADSAAMLANTSTLDRFPPELLVRMREMKMKSDAAAEEGASVTIEDFVEGADADAPAPVDENQRQ